MDQITEENVRKVLEKKNLRRRNNKTKRSNGSNQ